MTGARRRIDSLTAAEKAAMDGWADDWIAKALCTDEADWVGFEDAARRCYASAGIPWHGNVVRVSSPIVGALAAPIAAWLISEAKRGAVGGAVNVAVGGAVGGAALTVVRSGR